MSAIKLPVTVEKEISGRHRILDAKGSVVAGVFMIAEAEQIAVALNLHGELVRALQFYARFPEACRNRMAHDLPGNMNDWHAEICSDAGDIARAALERAKS